MAIVPVGALDRGQDHVVTAGSWTFGFQAARFAPRFAAVPGATYAVLGRRDDPAASWVELARVGVPDAGLVATTRVENIDPGGELIPENLLRFAVSFSAAMEEGSAAGHVHLLDKAGAELPGTLLVMPPELWDRDRRRLTVLVEPGRIKRGLQPNVQAGVPFGEGSRVTLVVDAAVRDARGMPLVSSARRTYRVGAPVRAQVDPELWEVRWPGSASATDAVVVRFDRPLDRALVHRCLRVVDDSGRPVAGQGSLDAEGQTWSFVPTSGGTPWSVTVDSRLEDLAGNSVRREFDRDLSVGGAVGDGGFTLSISR